MERKNLLIFIVSLVLVVLSSGRLGAARSIEFFVLVPPEQMLENVRKVAVLDFIGTGRYWRVADGIKASDYIVASLLEKSRGMHDIQKESTLDKLSPLNRKWGRKWNRNKGKIRVLSKLLPFGKKAKKIVNGENIKGRTFQDGVTTDFYEVVERSRIQQVLKEQNFSNSDLVDPEQAAQLGKILGVDAVIFGSGEVSEYYRYRATVTLSMRIVEVKSAKILGQKVVTKTVGYSSEVPTGEAVREKAIEEAAREAVIYFTPCFSLQKIDFQKLKLKKYRSDSQKAMELLERGDLGRALAIYTSIVDRDPYNHRALYMQGVVYELASDYDRALEQYNMAYQVFDEADQYHEAIIRTEGQQNLWKVLNRNGVPIPTRNLLLSKRELERAGKPKVRLKGNSKIRIPVYTSPGNSEVMMNVPGGISMELISVENNFFKVKLITGKEGYVNNKDVENSRELTQKR
jgi:tetratricopeptide (TPR) repeat protein